MFPSLTYSLIHVQFFWEYHVQKGRPKSFLHTCIASYFWSILWKVLPILHWIFLLSLLRRSWEWKWQFDFVLFILWVGGYPCALHQTHTVLFTVALCTCWKYKWNLFYLLFYKDVNINVMSCFYISGQKKNSKTFDSPSQLEVTSPFNYIIFQLINM